jgi:UDP-3-O-[3-hydroxymyristoyl] glucosamine N-acyltransferase
MPQNAEERALVAAVAARNAVLAVAQPRLLYAQLLTAFFAEDEVRFPAGVDPAARVDASARLGERVVVGPFCFVGPDVEIGDDTVLHPGVVIHAGSRLGRRCVVKAHAVVGNPGFGFVRRPDGSLEAFPQIGRVVIEDDVVIGAASAIDRPGLGTTRVRHGTKIDNLVHVGHGAQVGPHAVVAACAEIGASVVVGEGAWLGPHSCSLENVRFGERAFVGLGAVVVKDVAADAVVAGSPAEPTESLRRTRQALRKLVESDRADGDDKV